MLIFIFLRTRNRGSREKWLRLQDLIAHNEPFLLFRLCFCLCWKPLVQCVLNKVWQTKGKAKAATAIAVVQCHSWFRQTHEQEKGAIVSWWSLRVQEVSASHYRSVYLQAAWLLESKTRTAGTGDGLVRTHQAPAHLGAEFIRGPTLTMGLLAGYFQYRFHIPRDIHEEDWKMTVIIQVFKLFVDLFIWERERKRELDTELPLASLLLKCLW